MLLVWIGVVLGVCLPMQSVRSCVGYVLGRGQLKMGRTVTKWRARVTVIVFSSPLRATASTVRSTTQAAAATTGRVRSIRTIRTSRGSCSSIPAMCSGTTATVTTDDPSVQFASRGLYFVPSWPPFGGERGVTYWHTLGRIGYSAVTQGGKKAIVRGWIVYQRNSEEMIANKRLLSPESVTV